MKKITALLLTALLLLSASGCGGKKEETVSRLEQIKERGYLQVATEPYWVPNEFIDPNKTGDDQYVGMDIELARYIADKLGVELQIVPLEFSAVLTSITEGKYDMAISALAYSEERAAAMNLSDGYYFGNESYGLLVRSENAALYSDAAALKDAVIVTQSGSVQESFVLSQIPAYAELKLVSAMPDGFLMVQEGKADACACAIENAKLYIEANPEAGLAIAEGFAFTIDESTAGVRVGMPLGEDELTQFVNECIAELRESGQIDAWYDEYVQYAKTLGLSVN